MNEIDKKAIIRRHKPTKTVMLTIRITPEVSKWLKENDYSPTGIFNQACKLLGYKEE